MAGVQDAPSGQEPVAETVSALLEEARWMLDEERSQGARLGNGLGLLAGFVALVLALVVPWGGSFLGGTPGIFFDVFHVGSMVLLAGSALLAINALLGTGAVGPGSKRVSAPRRRLGVDDGMLDEFGGKLAAESTIEVERKMTAALVEGIRDQRDLNGRRWSGLRLAALGVGGALVLLVGQGVVAIFAW